MGRTVYQSTSFDSLVNSSTIIVVATPDISHPSDNYAIEFTECPPFIFCAENFTVSYLITLEQTFS